MLRLIVFLWIQRATVIHDKKKRRKLQLSLQNLKLKKNADAMTYCGVLSQCAEVHWRPNYLVSALILEFLSYLLLSINIIHISTFLKHYWWYYCCATSKVCFFCHVKYSWSVLYSRDVNWLQTCGVFPVHCLFGSCFTAMLDSFFFSSFFVLIFWFSNWLLISGIPNQEVS